MNVTNISTKKMHSQPNESARFTKNIESGGQLKISCITLSSSYNFSQVFIIHRCQELFIFHSALVAFFAT